MSPDDGLLLLATVYYQKDATPITPQGTHRIST